ncbi:MAG: hypothetical protein EPN93_08980 [Spirochaetes bacterium]|nr:MAG: hypothetical protein EPN93_08980 [Spirochaetota bacterium]
MRKLTEAISRLTPEEAAELSRVLHIDGLSGDRSAALGEMLNTYSGIHALLSGLARDELLLLRAAIRMPDGITYGDAEKALKLDGAAIERNAASLAKRVLAYVFKNRQRLHNKLDKVHIYQEIQDLLVPVEPDELRDHFSAARALLREIPPQGIKPEKPASPDEERLLQMLFLHGGVISIEEAGRALSIDALEKAIAAVRARGSANVRHVFTVPFQTLIVLEPDRFPGLAARGITPSAPPAHRVQNHYNFLLNILSTFDTVSSFGLFYTKQREFRKVDWKRLCDAMMRMEELSGEDFTANRTAELCLSVLHALKCCTLTRDAVVISLKPIERELDSPQKLLLRVLRALDTADSEGAPAPSPFQMPALAAVRTLFEIISDTAAGSIGILLAEFVLGALSAQSENRMSLIDRRDRAIAQCMGGLRLMCLCGIIEAHGAVVELSDIGAELAYRFVKTRKPVEPGTDGDCRKVYINPDFTMIIPKDEISSEAGYHLLARAEIVRDDMILHTRLSRASIVRANKRGMSPDEFLATLERCSKNEIPQNLHFVLNEWEHQTIRLKILDATVIRSSHPSLLDELENNEQLAGFFERIAPAYAIIDRGHLDTIIKIAQKRDAVITLFEDEGAGISP